MKEFKKIEDDKRLSYSSATLLTNCELRYAHKKIYKTKIDSDASESTDAFDIGKAFHGVLEETLHQMPENLTENVLKHCKEQNCEGEIHLVEAMVRKYLDLHECIGLTCIKCEYEIKTDVFIGFIDAIMVDLTGHWWIVDLKTASRVSEMLTAKLARDVQLNLYGSYHEMVAKDLNLDPKKYLGARYRVTTKASLKRKTSETNQQFVQRLMGSATMQSYDVAIPRNDEIMNEIRVRHQEKYLRSLELRNGEVPRCNPSNCDSYYKPCEYWSQCFGDTYTNCEKKLQLRDLEYYKTILEL